MSNLGDAFPEEFKKDFAARNLKPGSVIRCFVFDTKPPKEKRFVILAFSFDKIALGTLYINSEINPNLFRTEELRKLHLKFEIENRPYLEHDSYIDCSDIYEKSFEEIKQILTNNSKALLGELNEKDFKLVSDTVKSAKTITPALKKKFGVFL
ncbi:MAG: hypothetical protein ABI855_01980 [Bacteroidota bacterium]